MLSVCSGPLLITSKAENNRTIDRSLVNYGKWFEPRSLSRLCGLIVRVRVVPRRTVVGPLGLC